MAEQHTAKLLLRDAKKRNWAMQIRGKKYKTPNAAWKAIEETGEETVRFTDADGTYLGWAYMMVPGPLTCANDETVVDHTTRGEFGALCDKLIQQGL